MFLILRKWKSLGIISCRNWTIYNLSIKLGQVKKEKRSTEKYNNDDYKNKTKVEEQTQEIVFPHRQCVEKLRPLLKQWYLKNLGKFKNWFIDELWKDQWTFLSESPLFNDLFWHLQVAVFRLMIWFAFAAHIKHKYSFYFV